MAFNIWTFVQYFGLCGFYFACLGTFFVCYFLSSASFWICEMWSETLGVGNMLCFHVNKSGTSEVNYFHFVRPSRKQRMPYFNCHFVLLFQFTELCPSLWKSDCGSRNTTFITRRDLNPKEKEGQWMQISRTRLSAQWHKSPGHCNKL